MELVVMGVTLKMIDDLLPIGCENVLVLSMQTLVYLATKLALVFQVSI